MLDARPGSQLRLGPLAQSAPLRPVEMRLTQTKTGDDRVIEIRPAPPPFTVPLIAFTLIVWMAFAVEHPLIATFSLIPILAMYGFVGLQLLGTRVRIGPQGVEARRILGRSVSTHGLPPSHFACIAESGGFLEGRKTRWVIRLHLDSGEILRLPVKLAAQDHARYLVYQLNRALEETRTPLTYRG